MREGGEEEKNYPRCHTNFFSWHFFLHFPLTSDPASMVMETTGWCAWGVHGHGRHERSHGELPKVAKKKVLRSDVKPSGTLEAEEDEEEVEEWEHQAAEVSLNAQKDFLLSMLLLRHHHTLLILRAKSGHQNSHLAQS